jgi:hypothetical protein
MKISYCNVPLHWETSLPSRLFMLRYDVHVFWRVLKILPYLVFILASLKPILCSSHHVLNSPSQACLSLLDISLCCLTVIILGVRFMFHSTPFLLSTFYIPSFKVCLAIFSDFFLFLSQVVGDISFTCYFSPCLGILLSKVSQNLCLELFHVVMSVIISKEFFCLPSHFFWLLCTVTRIAWVSLRVFFLSFKLPDCII